MPITEAKAWVRHDLDFDILHAHPRWGRILELVPSQVWLEIEGGVVSGVFDLESSGLAVPDWRPRHDKHYHEYRRRSS